MSKEWTEERIEGIEKYCEALPPERWVNSFSRCSVFRFGGVERAALGWGPADYSAGDVCECESAEIGDFVVEARTDLPAAMEEMRRLRGCIKVMTAIMDAVDACMDKRMKYLD